MPVDLVGIIVLTFACAALATPVMLVPGTAVGWLLARTRVPGRTLIETLVALPLVLPPVATGVLLLRLLSPRSLLGQWLDAIGFRVVFTWKAVVIAMAVMGFPLVVRAARAGFEQVPRRFEDVAATLGASPWRVFTTITVPLARRSLLAGALLGFSRALGEFGATLMIAGNIPGETRTIAMGIYAFTEAGRRDEATTLILCAIVMAFVVLWLANRLDRGVRA